MARMNKRAYAIEVQISREYNPRDEVLATLIRR